MAHLDVTKRIVKSVKADMARKLAVTIGFCALLTLGGCVGGPGSYFEQVSRETRQNKLTGQQSQQRQIASADLAIEPVSTNELEDATATNQVEPAPASQAELASTENPLPGVEPTLQGESDLPKPLDLTIEQNNEGDLLLTSPASTLASPTPQENTITYSPPITASTGGGSDLLTSVESVLIPGNPSSGFAIGSETEPQIDPLEAAAEQRIPLLYASIEHGQCKQGFGPRPKKISATNITPGDPYYIELRMRRTPLLPVGHTYVAYGRLGPAGEIVDEKLIMLAPVGGYAGAALASGIPMPGILKPHPDDCRIRPETAYRVSLNAQRYERLLREVQAAKREKPSYLLFAYNCNHFMTRIAKSVGLKPPKNIYVPALEYIYAMIENNEGRRISRR